MARKVNTREFKLQAQELLTSKDLSIAEVARKLGISEGCLRNWQATAKEKGEAAFPGHGNQSPAEDELTRLRAQVRRPCPPSFLPGDLITGRV